MAGGLEYFNRVDLQINDYDSDPDVTQEITIYRDSTGALISVVLENELMRVVALHTLTGGGAWLVNNVWGMITIEPTETSPRYISSTVLPFDNDVYNPLYPITGLFASLTFPTPDVARIECYFDPTKIDISNGCKLTTKIKGCASNTLVTKLTTTDEIKLTTTDDIKIKA